MAAAAASSKGLTQVVHLLPAAAHHHKVLRDLLLPHHSRMCIRGGRPECAHMTLHGAVAAAQRLTRPYPLPCQRSSYQRANDGVCGSCFCYLCGICSGLLACNAPHALQQLWLVRCMGG
jgi:hypothetical protein